MPVKSLSPDAGFTFPAPAGDFIAQEPPMRFIDEVLSANDQGAKSRTVIRSDAIAIDDEGRFPALALIEVMAQTIGIYAGRIERMNGRAPGAGLLLGTRRMEFERPWFLPGDVLLCSVEKSFESDEGLWQFDCRVTVCPQGDEAREEPAGRALLNVFNPPEGYFDRLR